METNYNGVIEQTPEEKAKNFTFAETVGLANANPVNWVEKKQPKGVQYFLNDKTWRRFDVRNQDGSGSCVIQTLAKLAGILAYIKWGIFLVFSAGLYAYRENSPQSGTGGVDAYKMGKKIGFTLESLLPSNGLNDEQMNAIKYNELHQAMNLKFDGYIFLPEKDIDAIASVIQTTKKGVMTWYRFGKGEWTDVPKILTTEIPNHHSIPAIDYTLYNGEKALVQDESWGDTFGMKGQRIITETFLKERNTHVSYPITFKFEPESIQNLPSVVFAKQLVFIPLDANQRVEQAFEFAHQAQIEDVKRYQDILKAEGCLPTNIASTGLYHNLTAKATMALQTKYNIAPIEEIKQLEGKIVGPKTLAYLNSRK